MCAGNKHVTVIWDNKENLFEIARRQLLDILE